MEKKFYWGKVEIKLQPVLKQHKFICLLIQQLFIEHLVCAEVTKVGKQTTRETCLRSITAVKEKET